MDLGPGSGFDPGWASCREPCGGRVLLQLEAPHRGCLKFGSGLYFRYMPYDLEKPDQEPPACLLAWPRKKVAGVLPPGDADVAKCSQACSLFCVTHALYFRVTSALNATSRAAESPKPQTLNPRQLPPFVVASMILN